jgi:hypothetical protein
MLLSKELEGATVERVYWAVPSRDWLPVVGEPFDTFRDAADHADRLMAEQNRNTAIIVNRIVFRKANGTTVDMEVARERRFR